MFFEGFGTALLFLGYHTSKDSF